jgi:uncharacterized protein (TIGR03435 family)
VSVLVVGVRGSCSGWKDAAATRRIHLMRASIATPWPRHAQERCDAFVELGFGLKRLVVSIKRSTNALPGPMFGKPPGGAGFNMTGEPIVSVVLSAFPIRNRDLEGVPEWARTERYDVIATATGKPSQADEQAMLRTMLAERMAFRGHVEQRDLPVFAVLVASADGADGRHFGASPLTVLPMSQQRDAASLSRLVRSLMERSRVAIPIQADKGMVVTSTGITMALLADILGTTAGRIVVDRTDLPGDYAFSLTYSIPRTSATADEMPTVFTAVQEQLGLRLEPARARIETLVVDHIERPTGN